MAEKTETKEKQVPKENELTNREIWRAYPAMLELSRVKLPVRASMELAKMVSKLEKPHGTIDKERVKLLEKYIDKKKGEKSMAVNDPKYQDFMKDFDEMLDMVWGEFKIDKVKLPEKIAGTCDKCNHNMDVAFLIESSILIPLQEKFVEVV